MEGNDLPSFCSQSAGKQQLATKASVLSVVSRNGKVSKMMYTRIAVVSLCLLAFGLLSRAEAVQMGHMAADDILFLGNSITFCPQATSEEWWGLSASDPDHDYAHLLVQKINQNTGGVLTLVPPDPSQTAWVPSDPTPNYSGNIINIADIFERSFDTWDNIRIQNQINTQPDIVVIQMGENTVWQGKTLEQFRTALDTILTGLKNSSNPHIFVTGYILGSNWQVDAIKQQLCEEDPDHLVYVDLSMVGLDPANIGAYSHPSDQGMAVIANAIYAAMEAHSVTPEPCSLVLVSAGMLMLQARTRRKRQA